MALSIEVHKDIAKCISEMCWMQLKSCKDSYDERHAGGIRTEHDFVASMHVEMALAVIDANIKNIGIAGLTSRFISEDVAGGALICKSVIARASAKAEQHYSNW